MSSSGKADWLALAVVAIETLTLQDLRDLMSVKMVPRDMELHA